MGQVASKNYHRALFSEVLTESVLLLIYDCHQ
jgi:hypothetical protein